MPTVTLVFCRDSADRHTDNLADDAESRAHAGISARRLDRSNLQSAVNPTSEIVVAGFR